MFGRCPLRVVRPPWDYDLPGEPWDESRTLGDKATCKGFGPERTGGEILNEPVEETWLESDSTPGKAAMPELLEMAIDSEPFEVIGIKKEII